MKEVYDKRVLHRLVGISPKAMVVQDVSRLKDTAGSNGCGASAVQSAWEPTDRSRETDGGGVGWKPDSAAKGQSHEIIDVDADVEESRYGIPLKKRRKIGQPCEAPIILTDAEEGSEDEVVVLDEWGNGVEMGTEGGSEVEVGVVGSGRGGQGQGRVKINRKREFWASKSGTLRCPSTEPT